MNSGDTTVVFAESSLPKIGSPALFMLFLGTPQVCYHWKDKHNLSHYACACFEFFFNDQNFDSTLSVIAS